MSVEPTPVVRRTEQLPDKAGVAQSPAAKERPEAKYDIHIEHAQGIVIGDQPKVTQEFGVKPGHGSQAGLASKEQRCADLAENIRETLELIKQYENQRRLADDLRLKRRDEREIADLRAQLATYEAEYGELGCK